jgi:alpha-mannosidase
MTIPVGAIESESRRSDGQTGLTIRTFVTLQKDCDRVLVKVEFENSCEDHYLKAIFPTGLSDADFAYAGGHFTVDARPIKPQGPSDKAVWPDMGTQPHSNFIDISDGETGIAFINDCLTEYQVLDNDQRTVALSLLRSVKNWICTERVGSDFPSQKQGQCLGKHSYRYAIKPHEGTWADADIATEALCFNSALVPIQTRRHTGTFFGSSVSLFEIQNRSLQFSALKAAADRDNSWVLRIFNPTGKRQKTKIRFNKKIKTAWLTNLNEQRQQPLKIEPDGSVQVGVLSQKIITIELYIK